MKPDTFTESVSTSCYSHEILNIKIPFFIQWTQIDNMTCRQSVLAGSQDNWLITQYIGKTVGDVHLPQVNIQIEFDVSQCEDTAFQQALSLYTFETGGSENTTAVRDINNYRLVERLFSPTIPSMVHLIRRLTL